MNWIYFYVIPLLLCLIGIYTHFRITISKDENPKEKRNLYELYIRYGFFLWFAIIPVANIIMIIVFILIQIGMLICNNIVDIAKKIKI